MATYQPYRKFQYISNGFRLHRNLPELANISSTGTAAAYITVSNSATPYIPSYPNTIDFDSPWVKAYSPTGVGTNNVSLDLYVTDATRNQTAYSIAMNSLHNYEKSASSIAVSLRSIESATAASSAWLSSVNSEMSSNGFTNMASYSSAASSTISYIALQIAAEDKVVGGFVAPTYPLSYYYSSYASLANSYGVAGNLTSQAMNSLYMSYYGREHELYSLIGQEFSSLGSEISSHITQLSGEYVTYSTAVSSASVAISTYSSQISLLNSSANSIATNYQGYISSIVLGTVGAGYNGPYTNLKNYLLAKQNGQEGTTVNGFVPMGQPYNIDGTGTLSYIQENGIRIYQDGNLNISYSEELDQTVANTPVLSATATLQSASTPYILGEYIDTYAAFSNAPASTLISKAINNYSPGGTQNIDSFINGIPFNYVLVYAAYSNSTTTMSPSQAGFFTSTISDTRALNLSTPNFWNITSSAFGATVSNIGGLTYLVVSTIPSTKGIYLVTGQEATNPSPLPGTTYTTQGHGLAEVLEHFLTGSILNYPIIVPLDSFVANNSALIDTISTANQTIMHCGLASSWVEVGIAVKGYI